MIGPETIGYPIQDLDGNIVGWRIGHPAGVTCDTTLVQCSCGRLQLGLRRADEPNSKGALSSFADRFIEMIRRKV